MRFCAGGCTIATMSNEPIWAGRLRSLMAEHRISVKLAATLAGVKPRTVIDWRKGVGPGPRAEAVAALCKETGVSSDWLLGLDS